ncbi:hypothetical protein GCM10028798_32160 [Humibacter antri]
MTGRERNDVAASDEAAIAHVLGALAGAAARLTAAGARVEALAEYLPSSRVLLVPRPERLRPLGTVWRLGVLLLMAEAADDAQRSAQSAGSTAVGTPPYPPALFATGSITRAHEPGRTTFIAASAERRRQLRVAAFRGRYRPGTSVNFDAPRIPLDASLVGASGPLTVREGAALVRWSGDPDALTAFDAYLAERVALLVEPPIGA